MISTGVGVRFFLDPALVCSANDGRKPVLSLTFPQGPELPLCRTCAAFFATTLVERLLKAEGESNG